MSAASLRQAARYPRLRRRVYRMLGGEGHKDTFVKVVDYALIGLIVLNCAASVAESVQELAVVHGRVFHAFDRFSVGVFTVEYLLRLWTAVESRDPRFRHPVYGRLRYLFTPLALVDLLAILPFYFSMLFEVDLRAMRVLRLLRVFKLTRYSQAMTIMGQVLRREARAIGAVLFIFVVILVFMASLMYLFEHPAQPQVFSDLPSAMWWAVVTMTTLGYGDMVPVTALGRIVGGCTAVIGVGMIALPAGVLASGFSEALRQRREEYLDHVHQLVKDGSLSQRQFRLLEESRKVGGLSHQEASRILRQARLSAPRICPHCGRPIELHEDERI